MTLYIAVLDDNPADRKQAERLLSREADLRTPSGEVLYIDTYGNVESILSSASRYDLFFVDISGSERDGMMVAVRLRNSGVLSPIVLCSDKIDYETKYGKDEDFIYVKKPLWQKDYARYIDHAFKEKEERPVLIEFRNETDTVLCAASDILYARENGAYINIAMTEQRSFHMLGDFKKFNSLISDFRSSFLQTSKDTVINMSHVTASKGSTFKMSDGAIIRYGIFSKKKMQKAWEEYIRQHISLNIKK
ncbi:LytTR family transcriptional regulator DNA-binding domain-containing protein [Lachnospiraceae bacterium C1.1]|nr:response regulator [Lachnospiraceae bacterium C1.1]